MSRSLSLLILALAWIIVCVAASGCIAPAVPAAEGGSGQGNGSMTIMSVPPGAETFVDNAFRGITPLTIDDVPAGKHTVKLALSGYESWSGSFPTTGGQNGTITAHLIERRKSVPDTTAAPAALPQIVPELHVDGYWEYPQGRMITENPVPLVIHTEAFNTGTVAAREVTVSANFYYRGRMACWNTLYLGTLAAGGHVSRESLVSCTLPLPISEESLDLQFENIAVRE